MTSPEERTQGIIELLRVAEGLYLSTTALEQIRPHIASAITAAVEERGKELLPFLPDPQIFSGWDDEGAPEDILLGLATLANLKGIELPAHIADLCARSTT